MVRGLGAAEEPLVGSTGETEGETLRAHLVWAQGQNVTSKGRGWYTKHSPTAWDGLLPGPRMLLGASHGSRGKVGIAPPAFHTSGSHSQTPAYPGRTQADLASSALPKSGTWDQMPPAVWCQGKILRIPP